MPGKQFICKRLDVAKEVLGLSLMPLRYAGVPQHDGLRARIGIGLLGVLHTDVAQRCPRELERFLITPLRAVLRSAICRSRYPCGA